MKSHLLLTALCACFFFNSSQAATLYSAHSTHFTDGEWFFLIGTPNGNYTLNSRMTNLDKAQWDGQGNPPISVGEATKLAATTMRIPNNGSMALKSIELRVTQGKKQTPLWFYLVKFTEYPYTFDGAIADVVVLLNGDVLISYSPK